MDRREALLAKVEERRPRPLFEEDYLLGVFDAHRMGALRFKLDIEGSFLNDNQDLASPPWATLKDLEFASLQLDKGMLTDEEALKWINLLLVPGASLGGARPKAGVADPEGHLWIAKFPSVSDKTNIGAWEMVANQLALNSGISISEGMIKKFNSPHHTFLSKRFDRQLNQRIYFASAMNLLGYTDGAEGASYLGIAAFIIQNGAKVNTNLEELWRRIVFNIAIKNTDDHLRNHGFLLTNTGWVLSPAFDVNPVYFGRGLTLNISETDNSLEMELALSVARYFRIQAGRAKEIVKQVTNAVAEWRKYASLYKISRKEQELMEPAFQAGLKA